MIPMPAGTQIWVACGTTDMRKGFDGLAMLVQDVLKKAAHSGHLFVFRGKRADRIKILWWDGTGLCLYAKRLERGRFVWPLTREGAAMIPMPAGTQIWVACGTTDMRKGFDGLAMLVQDVLKKAAHSGHLFVFRGKRADRIKILWWDGTGLCLYAKRLERGRFVWPLTREGAAILTPAQLSMLCEGIDWRAPVRTDAAMRAG